MKITNVEIGAKLVEPIEVELSKRRIDFYIQEGFSYSSPIYKESIECKTEDGFITILDCQYIIRINYVVLLFNAVIFNEKVQSIKKLKTDYVKIVTQSTEVNYVKSSAKYVFLNKVLCMDKKIYYKNKTYGVNFECTTDICNVIITGNLSLYDDYRKIYYRLLDILYLCYGLVLDSHVFHLGKVNETILYDWRMGLYDDIPTQIIEDESLLMDIKDQNIERAFRKWNYVRKNIGSIIEGEGIFFQYYLHATDIHSKLPYEIKISMLIQCLEGYMNAIHQLDLVDYCKKNKYMMNGKKAYIRNLIEYSILFSKNTKMVFEDEVVKEDNLKKVCQELTDTRNLFSHVTNKKDRTIFMRDKKRLYKRTRLLIRIILLEDMGINVNDRRLDTIIRNIKNIG